MIVLDLPQVDLMNFRVEYVRPRSGRCLCRLVVVYVDLSLLMSTCLAWRVFICISRHKWGVAWPATGQMTFGSWMAEIIGSIQTKTIVCVCISPASKEQTKFLYSVLKWLRAKILSDNWRYRVAKTRPKLVWNLNWSPERRYISSGAAKVHFWQQRSAVRSEWWSTSPYTMTFSPRKMWR